MPGPVAPETDRLTGRQLQTYLARIGLDSPPSADPKGLAVLQRAHRGAIPFENLDVRLGRGVSLDPEAIFEKLVTARRGGYCFEQNGLFLRALVALGFEARALLGRVWLRANGDVPPRTHQLNLVRSGDENWIADAGFGGGDAPPMRLAEGEICGGDGVRHRLVRDADHGWMVLRNDEAQYSFTEAPVWRADLLQSNHWCMSAPASLFVRSIFVSRLTPDGLVLLTDRRLAQPSGQMEIADASVYRTAIAEHFDLVLTDEETAALGLF